MLAELKSLAEPTVEFLEAITDEQLNHLYAGAKALLYPVEDEDFGIVPVEAMGYGLPVIAHESGGPQETIVEEKTGLFFQELTARGLKEAMLLADGYVWSPAAIHQHAEKFNLATFQKNIRQFVASVTV